MKTKDIKKGISLIVLIITIIVVIILAAVVILTLSKNNPIESAKEARFKEDVRTFQDELAMTVSKQYTAAGGHRNTKISTSDFDEIKEYIPSFSEKYRDKFIIQDDELKYTNKLDDNEKEYAQSINVREKNKLLPDEFQQVEYIESTGGQYICTNVIPDNNTGCKVKFKYTVTNGIQYVIGSLKLGIYRFNPILIDTQNTSYTIKNDFLYVNQKEFKPDSYKKSDQNIHYLEFNCNENRDIKFDSEYITKVNELGETNGPELYIFGRNHNGFEHGSSIKLYICSIYKDSSIVRNFIPCYSTITATDVNGKECTSGTVGLYDTVESKFYTNQGTGEFIAGPDVNE